MIASRFRPVGWVAAVAVAALACYLVSLRVATKRGEVTSVAAQILNTREDMRRLETELGTRSRLVQLERWNSDVLALAAPKADQYLHGEMQLASLAGPPQDVAAPAPGTPAGGAVQRANYVPAAGAPTPAVPTPVATTAPSPRPVPAVHVVAAVAVPHRARPVHDAAPALLHEASYAAAKARPHGAAPSPAKPAHAKPVHARPARDDAPALLHEASYAVPAKAKAKAGAKAQSKSKASAKPKAKVHLAAAKVAAAPRGKHAKPVPLAPLHEAAYKAPKPHRAAVHLASAAHEDAAPLLRHANYTKPAGDRGGGVRQVALLDETTLGAISRAAREETGEGKKRRQ